MYVKLKIGSWVWDTGIPPGILWVEHHGKSKPGKLIRWHFKIDRVIDGWDIFPEALRLLVETDIKPQGIKDFLEVCYASDVSRNMGARRIYFEGTYKEVGFESPVTALQGLRFMLSGIERRNSVIWLIQRFCAGLF